MKSAKTMIRITRLVACGVLTLGLGTPLAALAAGATAKINLSMTVLKHARLTVLAQPSAVVVTAADISRGYVDVSAPAQVAVRANSSGYILEIGSHGDFMRQIVVRGLGTDVQLSPAGGLVPQNSGGSVTNATLALGFRFILSEAARQGTYAWPVHLSVTPL